MSITRRVLNEYLLKLEFASLRVDLSEARRKGTTHDFIIAIGRGKFTSSSAV